MSVHISQVPRTFKYTTHPVESFLLQRFTSSLPMPPIAALGATALSACCGRVERGQTLRLLPLGQHSVLWWQVKQMPTPAVGSMATRKGHFHSCARAQMRDLQKDTDPSAPSVANPLGAPVFMVVCPGARCSCSGPPPFHMCRGRVNAILICFHVHCCYPVYFPFQVSLLCFACPFAATRQHLHPKPIQEG